MKKLMSLVLALVMCLSLSAPAFAADQSANQQAALEAAIQAEIQREEDRIFASVYAQLEAQNALSLMDIYKEILTPQIQANVQTKYGVNVARGTYTYTLANGGVIGYTGSLGASVLKTYLTKSQYLAYIDDPNPKEITVSDIYDILSAGLTTLISGWGLVFNLLALTKTYVDNGAKEDVKAAGYYAEIMNVSAGADQGSVMLGWDNHPAARIPSDSTNIHVERF